MNDSSTVHSNLSPNFISTYISNFREHQDSVRKHLQGQQNGVQTLLPSYLPPASYWTSQEKDIFFHGLGIYSRLRPDLIAADIKTKNTLDVCVYLDCLETAASRESDGTIGIYTEPAMEVSEDWVFLEDALSEAVNNLDSCSWNAGKDGVYAQRSCICPSIETESSISLSTSAYFNHLDSTCLMTQESILREAEAEAFGLGFPKTAESSTLSTNDKPSLIQGCASLGSTSSRPMMELATKDVLNTAICSTTDRKLQRLLKKRLYMRRKRAELAGKTTVPASIKLRPGRPKKVRKPSKPQLKNYKTMGRSESGSRTQSLDPEIASLLPQQGSAGSIDLHDEDMESFYETRSQGGLTKPYRIRKMFEENGVTGQVLSDLDFDFFHLSTLTRLMRLHSSVHDPEGSLDSISISGHTIRLFVDITREFVAEVVRRTVIAKEQEIRLKRTMKVWKYERDEITLENVTKCVSSMGLGRLDKENCFAHLFTDQEQGLTLSLHPAMQSGEKETHQEPADNISKDQFYRTSQFTLPESIIWCSLPSFHGLLPEDDTMAGEIDQKQIEMDLDEDEELDIQDMKVSAEYEVFLWKANTVGYS
ncbi:hypothetical protein BDN70DRAFT_883595 [Pholiota conissans]|uniref:Uncharacterized protein n=1 Tax=Pholiota conissans TaxID=109636 RepID=A0A9P6CWD2_9AGAR|nr:hypothetical protein BDN70DRAFT_883595 [Pholiota conissans]